MRLGKSPFVLPLLLLLAACGGGGSDYTPPSEAVQGIWRGSAVVNALTYPDALAMISGSGKTNLVLQFGSGGNEQLRGYLNSANGVLDPYSSSLGLFNYVGDLSDTYYLSSGTVIPGSSLTATLNNGGATSTITLNLAYDALYDRAASLALLSGTWSESSGGYTMTLVIDGSGTLNGSDTNGCVYTGSATLPDPAHNLYTFNLDIHTCHASIVYAYGQGILSDTTVGNDTLTIATTGSVGLFNTDSFIYRLTRN